MANRTFTGPRRGLIQTRRPANRGWDGFVTTAPVAVPAGSKVLINTFALNNPGIDETALRTVGVMSVVSDQKNGDEQQIGAFGLIVINDTALALGITGMPGPVTGIGEDGWFLYVPFANTFLIATQVGFESPAGDSIRFDSRAKRKVHDGTGLAAVVENAHATHAFNFQVVYRILSMVS